MTSPIIPEIPACEVNQSPLPPKVYLWERLVARVFARRKSRIGRRQAAIFDRLGIGSPWDAESSDDPIGLGSMSLLLENRRSPAPHMMAPDKPRSKKGGNPAIEKYRDRPKKAPVVEASSGTITVQEVRRAASKVGRVDSTKSQSAPLDKEVPTSNAAAPLRHRVVPAPQSGSGRIRFRHPVKK